MKRFAILAPALTVSLALGCVAPGAAPGPSGPSGTPSESPSAAPTTAAAVALSGIVYDDDLGPLAGVTVKASAGGAEAGSATTDASGRYSLNLAAGSYDVTASRAGWTSRTQTVNVAGATTLPFGGIQGDVENPYFLSTIPEVSRVVVEEAAPGGPLTFTAHFSEPLPEASRSQWDRHFRLEANGQEFLRARAHLQSFLTTQVSWNEAGDTFTLKYDGPYVPSGVTGMNFSVFLEQEMLDSIDPVTRENEWDDLEIVDAEGNPLGRGRSDFAFLRDVLNPLTLRDVADKNYGYTPDVRRWNLTHRGPYTFQAKADTTGPELMRVSVRRGATLSGKEYDLLELHFSEPMRAVRDADEEQFTRLDKDEDLVIINVSKNASGTSPTPLSSGALVQDLRFSRTDANVVSLYYPFETFKDANWVEVTLGDDVRDPAGNKANPDKSRATWPN